MTSLFKTSLTLVLLASLTFTSCKKYEEGPGISLRTKTARIVGDWQLEEVEINGTDYTADVNTWDLEFDKDGDFSSTFQIVGEEPFNEGGEWEFSNNKEEVELKYDDGTKIDIELSRLSNKELWFEFTNSFSDGTSEKWSCKFESN